MNPPVRCLIALGSNLGDRRAHLRFGLRGISALPGTRIEAVSTFHTTEPVGVASSRAFLNAAVRIRTRHSPVGLLVELKRLEALRGRKPRRAGSAKRWLPRCLDLDILYYGRRRVRSRILKIPHPRTQKRPFVLGPLAEVARLPVKGKI